MRTIADLQKSLLAYLLSMPFLSCADGKRSDDPGRVSQV